MLKLKHIHVKLEDEEHSMLKKTKKGTWLEYLRKASWFIGKVNSKPEKDFLKWAPAHKDFPQREKPCHKIKFCPYGQLVESFPLIHGEFSCTVFGHDCPVYYCAEPLSE